MCYNSSIRTSKHTLTSLLTRTACQRPVYGHASHPNVHISCTTLHSDTHHGTHVVLYEPYSVFHDERQSSIATSQLLLRVLWSIVKLNETRLLMVSDRHLHSGWSSSWNLVENQLKPIKWRTQEPLHVFKRSPSSSLPLKTGDLRKMSPEENANTPFDSWNSGSIRWLEDCVRRRWAHEHICRRALTQRQRMTYHYRNNQLTTMWCWSLHQLCNEEMSSGTEVSPLSCLLSCFTGALLTGFCWSAVPHTNNITWKLCIRWMFWEGWEAPDFCFTAQLMIRSGNGVFTKFFHPLSWLWICPVSTTTSLAPLERITFPLRGHPVVSGVAHWSPDPLNHGRYHTNFNFSVLFCSWFFLAFLHCIWCTGAKIRNQMKIMCDNLCVM